MKCPNCNVNLVMADRSGVEIDYCPDCRGVWLDRGELDKIIERSSQNVRDAQPNIGYHEKHNYSNGKHYDYKRSRQESFLGNLFDF